MLNTLTLLAPGQPHASRTPTLTLLDTNPYPESFFRTIAHKIEAGPGVETIGDGPDRAYRLAHPEDLERLEAFNDPVLFFATTDTDVKTLAPVARHFPNARFLVHPLQDDSGVMALAQEHLPFERNRPGASLPDVAVAVLASDWEPHRREFIRRCRNANIPTLCLQEAVNVDFHGPPHRMRWADAVALTGPQSLHHLQRDVMFLTGNPRYDGYSPAPPPESPRVLINCNFMLGFGAEWGRQWLDLVIQTVEQAGLAYRVTRHPRDDIDVQGIEHVLSSGAYKVGEQLAEASVLISRDSSLPYEALLMNRNVIYFDPFGEKERTLREDGSGLIEKCTTQEELLQLLASVTDTPAPRDRPGADEAFRHLFTAVDGSSHLRAARAVTALVQSAHIHPNDFRTEPSWKAAANEFVQLRVRPALRQYPLIRTTWRTLKRIRRT